MSTPLTIQEHLRQLMRNDKNQDIWVVIFYDPAYGHARQCRFTTEKLAHGYYNDLKSEGRKPRMFKQSVSVITVEVRNIK